MASWQFDLHLLPRIGAERRYGTLPAAIPLESIGDEEFWRGVSLTSALRTQISQMLPPLKSWTADIECWGYEDGNRIDIVLEKEAIVDFFVRVDVRESSQVFLVSLLQIARQNDWLVRTGDGRVFRPSLSRLLTAIQASQAFRFVQDPLRFLEALGRARTCDEERPPEN